MFEGLAKRVGKAVEDTSLTDTLADIEHEQLEVVGETYSWHKDLHFTVVEHSSAEKQTQVNEQSGFICKNSSFGGIAVYR
jgi:hypothetical protein